MAKYCMFCGEEIPNNAQFCPSCGKKQNEPSSSQAQQKTNSYGVEDINDEMDLLLKYGMMSNNTPKPKAQPKAIMIDTTPTVHTETKEETLDVFDELEITKQPEVSNVIKIDESPKEKIIEEPIQDIETIKEPIIKEPVIEEFVDEKSIIKEPIKPEVTEPTAKVIKKEDDLSDNKPVEKPVEIPLEEQKSPRRGPKRDIQKPKEEEKKESVLNSGWDDFDDFDGFDSVDIDAVKKEDVSLKDIELEVEEAPEEPEKPVVIQSTINRHKAARKDVSIKKRNISIDDDEDFSTDLKESSKNAMYETGKLLADEKADIDRRKNVKIEEDDEALDDRSHLEGRKQQTQKIEKRRQSARKYNEKKFYEIEQDQSEIDENDIGYDGYYENVLPIDHDQERKKKINWKNVLIVIGVLAFLVLLVYFSLKFLL